MDLHAIREELRRLPPDQLRELLAEFAPGRGAAHDLAEIQYSLAADRLEFVRTLAQFSQGADDED